MPPKEAAVPPEAPDTGTPPESTVTPETGAPPEAPQTESPEETDWKKRYEDLRPEADRRESLLADIEGRNGPERQAMALQEHARIELENDDEGPDELDDEFDLPPDPSEEIAKIRQELAERDEEAKAAEFERREQAHCEETIEALEKSENFKLSEEEYDFVVNRGLAYRDQHTGEPDLAGSFKAFKDSIKARGKNLVDGKLDTVTPPVGTPGEPKIDLRDKEARQKRATEVYEAVERAKET